MARDIPQDRPLSEADREYLVTRSRDDLIARIDENYPPESEVDEDGEVEAAVDYSGWTKADLLTEIKRRNAEMPEDEELLPEKGTQAQLADVLANDDAERAEAARAEAEDDL